MGYTLSMPRPSRKLPDKTCPVCGKQFNRRRFNGVLEDSTRYKTRHTCSQSCGNSRINPKARETHHLRARKFKKRMCEMCGTEKKLDAHHADGNIKNNTPKNIKTLCHPCHMKLHWRQKNLRTGILRVGTNA